MFIAISLLQSNAYSQPCQTSKMKRFVKIVNGFYYFRKKLILDVWHGSNTPLVIAEISIKQKIQNKSSCVNISLMAAKLFLKEGSNRSK